MVEKLNIVAPKLNKHWSTLGINYHLELNVPEKKPGSGTKNKLSARRTC